MKLAILPKSITPSLFIPNHYHHHPVAAARSLHINNGHNMHSMTTTAYIDPLHSPMKIPLCKNCKHFKYDMEISDKKNQLQYGRCELFGNLDLVTGNIEFQYAAITRDHENQCGLDGKYYKENVDSPHKKEPDDRKRWFSDLLT